MDANGVAQFEPDGFNSLTEVDIDEARQAVMRAQVRHIDATVINRAPSVEKMNGWAEQQSQAERQANTHLGLDGSRLGEDLSITLIAEAARRESLAVQQVQRWAKVRQALHAGSLSALTMRDLRALLDPAAP